MTKPMTSVGRKQFDKLRADLLGSKKAAKLPKTAEVKMLAARRYIEQKRVLETIEADVKNLRDKLGAMMKDGESIVVEFDGPPSLKLVKEPSETVDTEQLLFLHGAIEKHAPGMFTSCIVPTFSVERLHLLEKHHPALKKDVPYKKGFKLAVR
jgi:hypothetical protein